MRTISAHQANVFVVCEKKYLLFSLFIMEEKIPRYPWNTEEHEVY